VQELNYAGFMSGSFVETTGGFLEYRPTAEDLFRGVILFGRNVASYKFALGKSLLDLAADGKEEVSLEELSIPFAHHLCEHLQIADRQATSSSSKFLDTCRDFNRGAIDKGMLWEQTKRLGFVNVIDAFHRVGDEDIPSRFFLDERKTRVKGIVLTREIHSIVSQSAVLEQEVESRWRLVETAWSLEVDSSLILFDTQEEILLSADRRKNVTSARSALNGYQRGKCFYCFRSIQITSGEEDLADVDHVFPHVLQRMNFLKNLDGVWNLVLACRDCNRGPNGKFDSVPDVLYVDRLFRRNNYLISSHNPLRETLIGQTGETVSSRHSFLQDCLDTAREFQPSVWIAKVVGEPTF